MTEETLLQLRHQLNKAENIKFQISELSKTLERRDQIKLWGICLYYDEECEEKLYIDLPVEEVQRFIEEFVINQIKVLEQKFADL